MDQIARYGPFTYYRYGDLRREYGFCQRVMLTIEHRRTYHGYHFELGEHWNRWWGYLGYWRWYGYIQIYSYFAKLEWGIRFPHRDAYLGTLFRG